MGKPFESGTCSGTLENANGRKLEVKRRKKERVRDIVNFMVYDNVLMIFMKLSPHFLFIHAFYFHLLRVCVYVFV